MNSRDQLFEAFVAVFVGTAKRFLYRRHLELWDRDAAALRELPERKRWMDLVKGIDEILRQIPTYDSKKLEEWEAELESAHLPSLVGLHLRWTKDYQRILKTAKLAGDYDRVFIEQMCRDFRTVSDVESRFLRDILRASNEAWRRATPADVLRAMQKRPGMYFGRSESPFSVILAFITGVEVGPGLARTDFTPVEFRRFVVEKYGYSFLASGKGGETIVRENSKGEEDALELFIRLREEFEASRLRDKNADSSLQPPAKSKLV